VWTGDNAGVGLRRSRFHHLIADNNFFVLIGSSDLSSSPKSGAQTPARCYLLPEASVGE